MKAKVQPVFECDFCGRKMLGKGAMSRHERLCNQNPNNFHKCFCYCVHLEKTHEVINQSEDPDYGSDEIPTRITHFICGITKTKMYSYKFEKAKGFNAEYIKGLIRMPLECDLFEENNELPY